MSTTPLSFTVFTSTFPTLLSKRFELKDGKLDKSSVANMAEGTAHLTTCQDLRAFNQYLQSLTSAQALGYGIAPGYPVATIRPNGRLREGDIARTGEFFKFSDGPGIMMLDHDGTQDGVALSAVELRARLIMAVPEFAHASMLWRVSASSGIADKETGDILSASHGQRLYIAVQNAALIPEAGKALEARLWAAGLGWIVSSSSGSALKRTLVDGSVWQANHLDFAGPPELAEGLVRNKPESRFFGDPAAQFDLKLIQADHNVVKKAKAAQAAAIKSAKPALEAAKAAYLEAKAPGMAERRGLSVEDAQRVLGQAADRHTLSGDFELLTANGIVVTVRELLANPELWNNHNFCDPLEPEYGDFNDTVARAHLGRGKSPVIHSFAHGSRFFYLQRPCQRIRLVAGQRPRVVDDILEAIQEQGDIYKFGDGGGLAHVTEARATTVTKEWLLDYIDRSCEFYKLKDGIELAQDGPTVFADRVLAKASQCNLPKLEAVVTAPILRRDGSVLDEPGYDQASGLLYVSHGHGLKVPEAPTPEQALQALQRLWHPVRLFPFVGPEDRGVALAAMLTAVMRAALPSAPGFAFDAPSAGSGKTLLASVLGVLATGTEPAVSSPSGTDEEMRKRLFASLLDGAQVVLWDNLSQPLGGPSLDAFLTAPFFSDRLLGSSKVISLPNRALFLCTGNNIRQMGDTNRRVLKARIDPKSEQPFAREFDFDPVTMVKQQRQQLVVDALTIVRAYLTAGAPRLGKGRTASFEIWDDLVRQSVIWIALQAAEASMALDFKDPMLAMARQFEEDPETQKLNAFMTAWFAKFGDKPTTVAEAIRAVALDDHPLRDAMMDVALRSGAINGHVLGRWLEKNRERPLAGLMIDRGTVRDGRQQWAVCQVKTAPTPAPETPSSIA